MENGKRRARRRLTREEKWELFLEVTSQDISQADAARKCGIDVSVIIRSRALAKDAALAAFASAEPGRRPRRYRSRPSRQVRPSQPPTSIAASDSSPGPVTKAATIMTTTGPGVATIVKP